MRKLTDKQAQFAREYAIDYNATQAAIRAGYSKKTADTIGFQLLQKTWVQEAIRAELSEREQRTHITQDRVLQELAAIAFAKDTDYTQVAKVEGEVIVGIVPTDDLTETQKAAIAGIRQTQNGIEVKTHDKTKALELLGRHLGMFTDKVNVTGAVPVIITGEDSLEE